MEEIKEMLIDSLLFELNKQKRVKKVRSIDEIHDLYLKCKERESKKLEELYIHQEKIIKLIPKDKNDEHIVYFENNGTIFSYIFRYSTFYKSYSVSRQEVKFKTRSEKLKFLLISDHALSLGNEYRRLDKLCSTLSKYPWSIIVRKLDSSLKKYYSDNKILPKRTSIVSIGSKKYFIDCEDIYSYSRFRILHEYVENDIVLNLNELNQ